MTLFVASHSNKVVTINVKWLKEYMFRILIKGEESINISSKSELTSEYFSKSYFIKNILAQLV